MPHRTIRTLSLFLVGACTAPGAARIQGHLADGRYASPDRSFSVVVPALLGPDIRDSSAVGYFTVGFRDDLCREYFVSRTALPAGPRPTIAELRDFYLTVIEDDSVEVKEVETRFGPTLAAHTFRPTGGPCISMTGSDSGWVQTRPPARFASYSFLVGAEVWEVGYLLGDTGGDTWGPTQVGPPDAMLDPFFASLEISSVRDTR